MTDDEARFVEDMGLLMEEFGQPRIGGRIIGWLLICQPPHQSFNALVEALGVSKGSVSSVTRLLIEAGIVERFAVPHDRQTYFRIRPHAWKQVLERQLRIHERLGRLAEDALAAQAARDPEADHRRLRGMRAISQLVLARWPELIAEYERTVPVTPEA